MHLDEAALAEHRARIEALADEHAIDHVRVGGVDIDGIWRGKRVALGDFLAHTAASGTHLCNAVFAVNMVDELIAGLAYTNTDTGFPNVHLIPDLATFAPLAWRAGAAGVLADFVEADGTPTAISPRQVLRAVVERLAAHGWTARIGYELEFHLFAETPASAHAKDYAGLATPYPGTRTYSLAEIGPLEDLLGDLARGLAGSGVAVGELHTEFGPGQFELNLEAADPIAVADQVIVYKTGVREIARSHGLIATFMAKPDSAGSGSSAHVHQSMWDAHGRNVFAGDDGTLSTAGRQFLAGQLATMADLTTLSRPTVNSYKRATPYSFAATTATWGTDNRTTGLRVLVEDVAHTRIEHRLAGADANPYLVLAAHLAGGLHGVEAELEPPPPTGDAYALPPDPATALPADLAEAVERLDASKLARALLGEAFVEHFATTRRHEVAMARAAVTDWERNRYFDVV